MSYKIKLRTFEGPFDLLVYLIENARMNIYDINISEITASYMAYLDAMKELDVNVGSEFMLLAAQLIEIKTRMLLPRINSTGDEVVDEDPRKELVKRILEYKRFKECAGMLQDKEEESMEIYEKPKEDISVYTGTPDEYLDLDMEKFVRAFNIFIHKKQKLDEVRRRYVRIRREKENAENRMRYIENVFRVSAKTSVPFRDLVVDMKDKYDVALSFTSLLEMMKAGKLGATQERRYGEITVTKLEGDTVGNK